MGELTFFLGLQVKQTEDGIFISQDKYVAEILRKFGLTEGKSASTPIDTEKPLLKDPDGEDVDVHIYRSMIGSLMYLTSSRPDIMFAVYARARFQVTPKASHLHAVKRIFRYLKGKPHLGLWYPKDSSFDLVAYSDSDYADVATSSTEAKYVAAASCCAQSADVTRLQALVDKKKVLISEAVLRDVLRLDDAEGVDCLPNEEIFTGLARRKFNFSKYIFDSLVRNVDSSSKFYMYPRFIQLIIQNQLGDLSTHTTQYTSPALNQKVIANMRRVGKDSQGLKRLCLRDHFIPSPAPPTLPPSPQAIPSTSYVQYPPPQPQSPNPGQPHGADFLMSLLQEALDACVALMGEKEEEKKAKKVKDIAGDEHVKWRQAEIYQIDMDHAVKVLSMQEEEPEVQEVVEVVTTAKLITEVVTAASTPVSVASKIIPAAEPKVPLMPQSKLLLLLPDEEEEWPQTKAQARRNMITYLKNTAGFRFDYFKGMSYDDIHPIFELYVSFITLLKNFDREDLESLWSLVKERFSTSKLNNFSDDYLLTTLRAMFGKPDGQDNVWKCQRSVHGQAMVKSWKLLESCGVHIISFTTTQLILLVERRYPLSMFTLDQMLNAVKL
nr:hypothetical protein [Tanacetum cinerariifolium]